MWNMSCNKDKLEIAFSEYGKGPLGPQQGHSVWPYNGHDKHMITRPTPV